MAFRRKRIDECRSNESLRSCLDLIPTVDEPPDGGVIRGALDLAMHHKLTFYDALCVELAARTQSLLASLDEAMLRAARNEGITVFGDRD